MDRCQTWEKRIIHFKEMVHESGGVIRAGEAIALWKDRFALFLVLLVLDVLVAEPILSRDDL